MLTVESKRVKICLRCHKKTHASVRGLCSVRLFPQPVIGCWYQPFTRGYRPMRRLKCKAVSPPLFVVPLAQFTSGRSEDYLASTQALHSRRRSSEPQAWGLRASGPRAWGP